VGMPPGKAILAYHRTRISSTVKLILMFQSLVVMYYAYYYLYTSFNSLSQNKNIIDSKHYAHIPYSLKFTLEYHR